MTIRTNAQIVTFAKPFTISGLGEVLPAGAYRIFTNAEILEGLPFPDFHRMSTQIEMPPTHLHPNWGQLLNISQADLATALTRDSADSVEEDTPLATPERTISGMAAELKNLIYRDRMGRLEHKDRS